MNVSENTGYKYCGKIMAAKLSDRDFQRLSHFIHEECGIKMAVPKKVMLEARLKKRLRVLGLETFDEYCDLLFSPLGMQQERLNMINVVTTNKTDFFREPRHFEYLLQQAIPELIRLCGAGMRRRLAVWSAGCSTGEEPYTLAMVLSEFAARTPGFNFSILATDISTAVLEKAVRGVYKEERLETVPQMYRKNYFMKSKDRGRALVRVMPEVRSLVRFRRLNFLDHDFGMREHQDIIFCRNVIIYFDRPTQEKVLGRLCGHLIPGGYLFMGHSETLSSLDLPLVSVGPMVYRRPL
ncbi:MAG: chemotaxis protein CheR [Nitrospirae bacterium]|nr:MAG: chemotaxis protein CheR [Nitrospirota bacterium]